MKPEKRKPRVRVSSELISGTRTVKNSHGKLSYEFDLALLRRDLDAHFKDILERAGMPESDERAKLIAESVEYAMLSRDSTISAYLHLALEDLIALMVCRALDVTLLPCEDFEEPEFAKKYFDEHVRRMREFVIGYREPKRGGRAGRVGARNDLVLMKKVIAEVSRQGTANPGQRITRMGVAKQLKKRGLVYREQDVDRAIERALTRSSLKTWQNLLKAMS